MYFQAEDEEDDADDEDDDADAKSDSKEDDVHVRTLAMISLSETVFHKTSN